MFRFYALIAAILGALSVAIGAFAAHGITDPDAKSLIQTGAHYHFMHVMAAIAALIFWRWGARRARFAPPLFFAGVCLFSGSLYALAFGAPHWAGAITPIGGLLFLAGWGVLAWAALSLAEPPA
ncbi:MAG: DUF423 domain-containing protein [Alphaproteobacteria bacterium]